MSSIGDSEHDAQKRGLNNIKGLWHDAFRTLKTVTTSASSSNDDETRSVRFSSSIISTCILDFYPRLGIAELNQVIQMRHRCPKRKRKKSKLTFP